MCDEDDKFDDLNKCTLSGERSHPSHDAKPILASLATDPASTTHDASAAQASSFADSLHTHFIGNRGLLPDSHRAQPQRHV